jgi:hypothetical protein
MSRKFISRRTAKNRAQKAAGQQTHAERPSGPSVPEQMRVVCDRHGFAADLSGTTETEPSPLERAYRPSCDGVGVLAQRLAAKARRERATTEGDQYCIPEGLFAFRAPEIE